MYWIWSNHYMYGKYESLRGVRISKQAKSLWLIRVNKHLKDTSVLESSMIWIEWTETVSWIRACLYMCMNHVCPSSSYVTTVEELQSYNDQASQEIECDMRYVNLCDLFCPKLTVCYSWTYVSILWAILTDNLFVWNAGWISYIFVSMTVKFEGTVSGIPWSDWIFSGISCGQFYHGCSVSSTAWVEAAASTLWIVRTALIVGTASWS